MFIGTTCALHWKSQVRIPRKITHVVFTNGPLETFTVLPQYPTPTMWHSRMMGDDFSNYWAYKHGLTEIEKGQRSPWVARSMGLHGPMPNIWLARKRMGSGIRWAIQDGDNNLLRFVQHQIVACNMAHAIRGKFSASNRWSPYVFGALSICVSVIEQITVPFRS